MTAPAIELSKSPQNHLTMLYIPLGEEYLHSLTFFEILIWLSPSRSLSLGWGELQLGRKLVDFNIQIARRGGGERWGGKDLEKFFPFPIGPGGIRAADLGANFSFPARLRSVL